MKVNRDLKVYITLAVLVLGLICTILALSTDHWFENKIYSEGLAEIGVNVGGKSITIHRFIGLWNICVSIKIPTLNDFTRCFKVTDWRKGSDVFSDNPLLNLDKGTDYPNYGISVSDNPLAQSFVISSDENNNPLYDDPHTLEKTDYGADNQSRTKRSFDDDLEDAERKAIYPDYLKGVQAMEVFALISGVAAIGVWIAYIFTSAMTRKGVASSVVKVIVIVLVTLTVVSHTVGVVVWVAEKEKEKSDMFGLMGVEDLPGMKNYYGWSWGMAVASTILHVLSLIPLALTRPNQPDDGMDHCLAPRVA